jgi:hypothetical protein
MSREVAWENATMDDDWVAEHDVQFGGAEGALTLRLGTGPTGALISREARVECGPLDGVVSGFFDFDPVAVHEELRALLQRPDLAGDVYLTGAEHGEFRATLSIDHGRGVLAMEFESGYAMQDGGGTLTLTTDQSHVNEALRQIERALRLA